MSDVIQTLEKYKEFNEWVEESDEIIKKDDSISREIESKPFTEEEIQKIVDESEIHAFKYMDFDEFEKSVIKDAQSFDELKANDVGITGAASALAWGAASGVSGGGVLVGAAAGYLVGALTTSIVKNRKSISMAYMDKWGKTTRSVVHKMYYESIKALISNKRLNMTVKSSGDKIIIQSNYSLPNYKPAKITLTITERAMSIFPENTGGSDALETIMFNSQSMNINPKRKVSSEIEKIIDAAGGLNNILGNGYKIPHTRALSYDKDLELMWYIIVDIISEIFADYANYFTQHVISLQKTKKTDVQPFLRLKQTADLEKIFYKDAIKSAKIKAEKERKKAEIDKG